MVESQEMPESPSPPKQAKPQTPRGKSHTEGASLPPSLQTEGRNTLR